jgi:hypothetical protein
LWQVVIERKTLDMMRETLAGLGRLVGIPWIAFPRYPPEPVNQMTRKTLRRVTVAQAFLLQHPAREGDGPLDCDKVILARAAVIVRMPCHCLTVRPHLPGRGR